MWEKLKELSQTRAAGLIRTLCGDPVQLYCVFLIMTAMYYYHEEWTWAYTIIALLLSFVLMRFYDFVNSKRLLGPLCYLIFLALGLYGTGIITQIGRSSYPISFAVWFLTPQGVVDFSLVYTIAIFILMTGFLTSAVYYFAKARYRMVMQFLIMLIPLSLYAKEDRHMPALLVILLLASYFLLMVYCRQLRPDKEVRHITGFPNGASIAVYVMAFSIIAAIIPKPQFEADREFIDNAMSYSTWSDVLMNAISMFTESTDNTVSISNNARTIYYVSAPESLRLRTQTYSYYLGNDSWNVTDSDRFTLGYDGVMTYQPRALTQAILDAAALDPDFAETYHLTDVVGLTLPEQQLQEIKVVGAWYSVPGIPTPTRSEELLNADAFRTVLSRSGTNVLSSSPTSQIPTVTYYSDTYARYETESAVLCSISHDDYEHLLADGADILLKNGETAESDLLDTALGEFRDAKYSLDVNRQLDYHSDTVDRLAAEITEGLDNDLDKALAIERYFTEQGFLYDQSFTKAPGDNVDQFLTESHAGVCYEYATAMVLLCRSAGIPARYVQGYNMSERYNTQIRTDRDPLATNFVIKMRDAHAFPEVYIPGYGWMSFEPTVASDVVDDGAVQNQVAMRWGYVLLVIFLIAIGIWALLPWMREQYFRKAVRRMTPGKAAAAIFLRMRRILKLSDSVTVWELSGRSKPFFDDDGLFSAMDALLYNPTEQQVMTAEQLAVTYEGWQARRKAYEKEQKKAHVNV